MKAKEFIDKNFDYLTICSEITDSRYTILPDKQSVRAGTRIMYDRMYGKIFKLSTEYEELKLKLDKAVKLIIDLNTFMVDLEIELDEDSCMGMAFVNNRVSEDFYYHLCDRINESGLLEKE